MLEVGWEKEFQNCIHRDLGADVAELRGSLWDREKEDVTLLVGALGVV